MVVCRYFLQGNCKFGVNCKFEHVYYSNGRGEGNSIMLQHRNTAPNPPAPKVDVATLIKSVQTDMLCAEKGGLWLFSSYSPFKEKPLYPGFEDVSPEEVRLGFYEAKANQVIDQYEKVLQAACHENQIKIRMLQNPTEEAVQRIQAIYNTLVGESTFKTFPLFSTASSLHSSSFASQPVQTVQQTGNIFPNVPMTQPFSGSIFGGSSMPSAPQAGIFATNSFSTQPPANMITQANKQNAGSLFTQQSQPAVADQQTSRNMNIFGGGDASTVINQYGAGRIRHTHYSDATDLTQEDTMQYKLDCFHPELVPIMPPSDAFCARLT